MSRQDAAVQRDAGPGQALHVRHEGVVIEVRVVLGLFLDDAEDAGGRLAPPLAARYRCPQEPSLPVVDGEALPWRRNDRQDRIAGFSRLVRFDGALARAASGVRQMLRTD